MTLYHVTTKAVAEAIVREGFRDSVGTFGTDREWRGVWLCDRPFDEVQGARSEAVLQVVVTDSRALADFEWIEEGKPYREWLVPAATLRELHADIRLLARA